MTAYTYLKSAFVSLSTKNVDAAVLQLQIETSSIGDTPKLSRAGWVSDDADPLYEFNFNGTLGAPAITTLDGIVAAHTGPLKSRIPPGIFRESVPPTVNDDITQGAVIGSTWIDTVTLKRYTCLDNTSTAADWHLELSDSIKTPAANESMLISTADGSFDKIPFAALFGGDVAGLVMTRTAVNSVQVSNGFAVDNTIVKLLRVLTPLTCALNTSGAGGLDTGVEAVSTIYYLHLIQDEAGTQAIDLLFSLSSTAPTLPGSYDVFRLIGHVLNDDSSNIVNFKQTGKSSDRVIEYDDDITSSPYEVLDAGGALSFVDIDLSSVVPVNSERAGFNFILNGGMGGSAAIRPDGFSGTAVTIEDKGTTSKIMSCPGQVIEYEVASGGDLTIQVSEIHYSI